MRYMIALLLLVLLGCSSTNILEAPRFQTVTLTGDCSPEMYVGETCQLVLTKTQNGKPYTPTSILWTSSDTTVATVDQNGNVQALTEGAVTITATNGNGERDDVSMTANIYNSFSVVWGDVDCGSGNTCPGSFTLRTAAAGTQVYIGGDSTIILTGPYTADSYGWIVHSFILMATTQVPSGKQLHWCPTVGVLPTGESDGCVYATRP